MHTHQTRRAKPTTFEATRDRLDEMLDAGLGDPAERAEIVELAAELLRTEAGLHALAERAGRFHDAGVFADGPWADPASLQVPLVAGTLVGPGRTPVVETLSELRMLAIARGDTTVPGFSAADAGAFLDEVMARNLRYLLGGDGATEQERGEDPELRASHERLFRLIAETRGLGGVLDEAVAEIRTVLAQRPVGTRAVRRMIARAVHLADAEGLDGATVDALRRLHEAAHVPSPLSKRHDDPAAYAAAIAQADEATLESEAQACAASMLETGLVAPVHGVLVRHVAGHAPEHLPAALGLDDAGLVELEGNAAFASALVERAVYAATAPCLFGLRALLERSLLSRTEVSAGLHRLLADVELQDDVREHLLATIPGDDTEDPRPDAAAILLAGTIAILGQPLGIGQGRNPTCQAARGMSLWAQHDPAHLVELIVAAARDGSVDLSYRGEQVRSKDVALGVAQTIDLDLDPVSIVIVPHLDRLYAEFMRRSMLLAEDAHKWVNPALYGQWIPNELATAFADVTQTTVADFPAFVRRFFATHHPEHNGGLPLMYPNPVGLVITNHHGRYLGPHAVSIQRVDRDPDGAMRVYFYNPNNEGRQDWGGGVITTVTGHGEVPGESSLPFDDFASRLYAFHYNPHEEGDLPALPEDHVAAIAEAARTTWGQQFVWLDPAVA